MKMSPRLSLRANVEQLESRKLLNGDPLISEFLAQNTAVGTDEDGTFSDWIEIHNPGTSPLNLSGYYLTDDSSDLKLWKFPSGVTVAPNAYLLVWASGKDRTNAAAALHTNFNLKAAGDYLGLVKPDGVTVVSEFAPSYPAQQENVSYGVTPGGLSFFSSPTPGAANGDNVVRTVAQPVFSHSRGFYGAPFQLTLRTDTEGATIRYTTDGSTPSSTSGLPYNGPITVASTRNIRAVAFRSGYTSSAVMTHSYIFLDSVLRQPSVIPGFPNTPEDVNGGSVVTDTAMDPEIVNNPAYSDVIKTGLKSIPTLSITAAQSDIFGSNGFYDSANERPASIELIDPKRPGNSSQINGGAESHSHDRLKRSMRISFKSGYGPNKWKTDLLKDAPQNGGSAKGELDNLVLRAGNNRAWTRLSNPDATTFTEDQWYRDTQIDMSGYGSHGTFVHLYLNGVYWGLYNVAERPDDAWQAEYFGGDETDYFASNQDEEHRGDASRWETLTNTLIKKDLSNSSNYNEVKKYLDVENFADYIILNWFQGQTDWPANNYNLGNRNTPSPTGIKFFAWDGEWSWDRGLRTTVDGGWVHPAFRDGSTDSNVLPTIWRAVKANADFRTLFADRVYKHLSPGGALSPEANVKRFDKLNAYIRDAVVAESARWGDALESLGHPTRTRDEDWQREVDKLREMMANNETKFVGALREESYYPSIDPATFSQQGGPVVRGHNLVLTNSNTGGTIYYTTDGSDPRLSGGGLSASAKTYTAAIPLEESATIRTRVKSGNTWSAENSAAFSVSAFSALRVTEVMYNPQPPNPPTGTDGDEFEYVRLTNTGDAPLNLAGVKLRGGIDFTFGDVTVEPGGVLTLVENPAAFAARYGAQIAIAGKYTEKLDDGGERLRLIDPEDNAMLDFSYDDAWHPQTDGEGYSLVIVDPLAAPVMWDDPQNWKASAAPGGTHGGPVDPPPDGNQPPAVAATAPATVKVDASATVTASVTDDGSPAGSTVAVAWTKVSGPGDVAFANATALSTTASFSAAGQYVLRATASDGSLTGASDVAINVLTADGEPVTPPQQTGNVITRFILIDPFTGQDLVAINDGDTINLAALPVKKVNIRAEAGNEVMSVQFGFDKKPGKFKPALRTDNDQPFSLLGDKRGKYKKAKIKPGSHRLVATPFSGLKATGTAGAPLTVNFNVVKELPITQTAASASRSLELLPPAAPQTPATDAEPSISDLVLRQD